MNSLLLQHVKILTDSGKFLCIQIFQKSILVVGAYYQPYDPLIGKMQKLMLGINMSILFLEFYSEK